MRNPQGYASLVGDEVSQEWDTITCGHCNRIVRLPAGPAASEHFGGCGLCSKFICLACVKKGRCSPWEEQMKKIEARAEALRSYGF